MKQASIVVAVNMHVPAKTGIENRQEQYPFHLLHEVDKNELEQFKKGKLKCKI